MSSAPRLFAYGGTGDAERAHFGAWPEIGRGALKDLAGLPAGVGRFHFGCGIVGGRPVLVFRERQNEESRGGYAFTLLLDAGDATWERFGWNAALLLQALGGDGTPLRPELRIDPDKLSVALLEQILTSLAVPIVEPGPDVLPAGAMAAWTGVAVDDSTGTRRLPSPDASEANTPADVARFLAGLPAWLRTGAGWLVGGTRQNAEAFGCRLFLGPASREDEPMPESVVARGKEILEAWTGLHGSDELAESLARFDAVPAAFWPERFGASPALLSDRLVLAYRLGRSETQGADVAVRLDDVLARGGPLAPELQRLAIKRLTEGRARGERALNELLARAWLGDRFTIMPATAGMIDPDALVSVLAAMSIEPCDSRVSPLLDLRRREAVWSGIVWREVARRQIPELARRAAQDLKQATGGQAARTEAMTRFLEIALARSVVLRGDMSDWEGLKKDPVIGNWVKRKLKTPQHGPLNGASGGPLWIERDDVVVTLEDAEEEAPQVVVELLTTGSASDDEQRRTTLRRLASEAAGRPEVVESFRQLLDRAVTGDADRFGLARRLAPEPTVVEPLVAAAGPSAARQLVGVLATEQLEKFEKPARALYSNACVSLRQRAALSNPVLTTALIEFLSDPEGSALCRRIATSVHGPDADLIDGNLQKLLLRAGARGSRS